MTFLFLLLVALVGLSLPVQTAVNARLQHFLGSPLSASFVSFAVGTLVVWLVAVPDLSQGVSGWAGVPWYAWTGGVCGLIGVTLYIVLFPRLGGIQTVLLPILGQIVMSMLIDTFGWFGLEAKPLGLFRLVGALVSLVGVCLAVLRKESGPQEHKERLLPWQLLGILAGALIAAQSAANGTLGGCLHSPRVASAISFTLSTLLLCVLVFSRKGERACLGRVFSVSRPWWTWTGGIIGVFIVVGFSAAAPVLGVGLMTVVSILGQLVSSVAIDRYGLLGAKKIAVSWQKLVGILVVFAGALLIYL